MIESASVKTIAKLYKSPTANARPITVVITSAGDLAQACNLPEDPGILRIDPSTSKASWRSNVTGKVSKKG